MFWYNKNWQHICTYINYVPKVVKVLKSHAPHLPELYHQKESCKNNYNNSQSSTLSITFNTHKMINSYIRNVVTEIVQTYYHITYKRYNDSCNNLTCIVWLTKEYFDELVAENLIVVYLAQIFVEFTYASRKPFDFYNLNFYRDDPFFLVINWLEIILKLSPNTFLLIFLN